MSKACSLSKWYQNLQIWVLAHGLFRAIVELLLTPRDSYSISGVELTIRDALLIDLVSEGVDDSLRMQNNT